jgi:hypothetical protein
MLRFESNVTLCFSCYTTRTVLAFVVALQNILACGHLSGWTQSLATLYSTPAIFYMVFSFSSNILKSA